jgi:hypothetical protein
MNKYRSKSAAALKRHEFEPVRKLMEELGITFDHRKAIQNKIEGLYVRRHHKGEPAKKKELNKERDT